MSEGGWLRAGLINLVLHSVLRYLSSAIDAVLCPLPSTQPSPLPYRTHFITCSANNAMPRPEKPMRVSVIVHVRSV